jgi:hypothetical protein
VCLDHISVVDGDTLILGSGRTASVAIGNAYRQDLMSRLNLI